MTEGTKKGFILNVSLDGNQSKINLNVQDVSPVEIIGYLEIVKQNILKQEKDKKDGIKTKEDFREKLK